MFKFGFIFIYNSYLRCQKFSFHVLSPAKLQAIIDGIEKRKVDGEGRFMISLLLSSGLFLILMTESCNEIL